MGNKNLLATLFHRLNLRLNTLENRKILQKKIYFLQEFGMDLGYDFGFYIYGPYSTDLTSDAFMLDEQFEVAENTIQRDELSGEDLDAIENFNNFIQGLPENELAIKLELLSSIHFLNNHIFNPVDNLEEMISQIEKRKPDRFSCEEIREAWNQLDDLDLLSN